MATGIKLTYKSDGKVTGTKTITNLSAGESAAAKASMRSKGSGGSSGSSNVSQTTVDNPIVSEGEIPVTKVSETQVKDNKTGLTTYTSEYKMNYGPDYSGYNVEKRISEAKIPVRRGSNGQAFTESTSQVAPLRNVPSQQPIGEAGLFGSQERQFDVYGGVPVRKGEVVELQGQQEQTIFTPKPGYKSEYERSFDIPVNTYKEFKPLSVTERIKKYNIENGVTPEKLFYSSLPVIGLSNWKSPVSSTFETAGKGVEYVQGKYFKYVPPKVQSIISQSIGINLGLKTITPSEIKSAAVKTNTFLQGDYLPTTTPTLISKGGPVVTEIYIGSLLYGALPTIAQGAIDVGLTGKGISDMISGKTKGEKLGGLLTASIGGIGVYGKAKLGYDILLNPKKIGIKETGIEFTEEFTKPQSLSELRTLEAKPTKVERLGYTSIEGIGKVPTVFEKVSLKESPIIVSETTGKPVINVHVTGTSALSKSFKGDVTQLKGFPGEAEGFRNVNELFPFYTSAPKLGRAQAYLSYALGGGESPSPSFKLGRSKIEAYIFEDVVSPTPKSVLKRPQDIITNRDILFQQQGKTFVAPENIALRSTEGQLVTPASYITSTGKSFEGTYIKRLKGETFNLPGQKDQFIDWQGRFTIYTQKKEAPLKVISDSKTSNKVWDLLTASPKRVELIPAKKLSTQDMLKEGITSSISKEISSPSNKGELSLKEYSRSYGKEYISSSNLRKAPSLVYSYKSSSNIVSSVRSSKSSSKSSIVSSVVSSVGSSKGSSVSSSIGSSKVSSKGSSVGSSFASSIGSSRVSSKGSSFASSVGSSRGSYLYSTKTKSLLRSRNSQRTIQKSILSKSKVKLPKSRYIPSVVGIAYNKRATKVPGELSGIGYRPLITKRRSKKYKVKL